jgi:hypothetical protein
MTSLRHARHNPKEYFSRTRWLSDHFRSGWECLTTAVWREHPGVPPRSVVIRGSYREFEQLFDEFKSDFH